MEPQEVVEDTIEFWQPRTSRPLTHEDGRQAVENVTGFFATLERWAEHGSPPEPDLTERRSITERRQHGFKTLKAS